MSELSEQPFVSESCCGEFCWCGAPAEHKVEETIFADDPVQHRHGLTAYVCHEHFRQMMGPAADDRLPREFPVPSSNLCYRPLGLLPCCIMTLSFAVAHHKVQSIEGETLMCEHCDNLGGGMICLGGAWQMRGDKE